MIQNNNGLFIESDIFEKIKDHFKYKNQKKEQIKRMQMYGPYTNQVIKKMPDEIEHFKFDENTGLYKIPLGLLGGNWYDKVKDETQYSTCDKPEFLGKLYNYQQDAVDKLLAKRVGILNASTGVGKGVIIPYIASNIPYKTLIIVPGIQLLNEMKERIQGLLGCIPKIYGGKKQGKKVIVNEDIILTTLDSMFKVDTKDIGCIIIDECDKSLSSEQRLKFIDSLSPKYLYGLTGTMRINNVDDKIFNIYFGNRTSLIIKHYTPDIYRIKTEFEYSGGYTIDEMKDFAELNNELALDNERNDLICRVISQYLPDTEMKKGLVLSNRVEHCYTLSEKLNLLGIETRVIVGEIQKEEREEIKKYVAETNKPIVLLGSSQILGRGFDLKELQSIFLTYPTRFDSNVIQACGRVQREAPNKTYSQIFDFVDVRCGVLNNQANQRLRTMKREYGSNIKITNIY